MDGLMQHLASRRWRDVLAMQGPAPADAGHQGVREFGQEIGQRIVATKQFKAGTDPRERELNNPALLTSGTRDTMVSSPTMPSKFAARCTSSRARASVVGAIDLEPVACTDLGAQRRPRLIRASRS